MPTSTMLTSHHGITTATVSEQASLEAVNEANQPVATCDGNNPFPVLIGADIAFAMEELLLVTCEPLTQRAQLDEQAYRCPQLLEALIVLESQGWGKPTDSTYNGVMPEILKARGAEEEYPSGRYVPLKRQGESEPTSP